jgi:hypothetical protein
MPQLSRTLAAPVPTTDDLRICGVSFDDRAVRVTLMNRRAFDLDLQRYPTLLTAPFEVRMGWMLVDGGHGLSWPMLGLGSSALGGLINSRELVRQAAAPRLVGAPAVGV